MQFAKVIGTVVCTRKDEKLEGRKLLLVQPVNIKYEPSGNPLVAVDAVQAGTGELVLLCSGSSARQTKLTESRPCDAVIMAIVDTVERDGTVTFDKSQGS
ncbi:MAG: ethanolamine utilization protein EutN [Candidatus Hydrogenedentes bacterium CG07_land_8_20_14_0_80_42_17]|nr:MAG: ethanolamine utilization protein EutN [Candidatus Hydrogenedentes bacterium CG1_02_42_14]PIU48531.1 MAG: ethanolamine utilization protein EutN [Candidatus Hydrogenedentes bacterium CG07_land_8_20_14_0_80_42_17]